MAAAEDGHDPFVTTDGSGIPHHAVFTAAAFPLYAPWLLSADQAPAQEIRAVRRPPSGPARQAPGRS
jgi:hypothetical protein